MRVVFFNSGESPMKFISIITAALLLASPTMAQQSTVQQAERAYCAVSGNSYGAMGRPGVDNGMAMNWRCKDGKRFDNAASDTSKISFKGVHKTGSTQL
jgi:hypothetical protein